MAKNVCVKKYPNVYKIDDGRHNYLIELGVARITDKRIQKHKYMNENNNPFKTAKDVYITVQKIKAEYLKEKAYSDYSLQYDVFLKDVYIPVYKSDVKLQTFYTSVSALENVRDAENFRIFLLNESVCSQGYVGQVYGICNLCKYGCII